MSDPSAVIAEVLCGKHFDGMHLNLNGGRLRWGSAFGISEGAIAALTAAGYELVKLPMPGEYGPGGQRIWNDYPFVKQRGEDILLGASCEHVYTINCHEARLVAGDLLAAANHAEEAL